MANPNYPFFPHGLVATCTLHAQYCSARSDSYTKVKANPKETENKEFLENIFNKVIARAEHVYVNSAQLTGPLGSKGCDLAIKCFETHMVRTRMLCFVTCKRTKSIKNYSLTALEKQAIACCKDFLSREKTSSIYAVTALGARVRLWKIPQGGQNPISCWGSDNFGDFEHYKDIGDNEDGAFILSKFRQVLKIAPTASNGQTSATVFNSSSILGMPQQPLHVVTGDHGIDDYKGRDEEDEDEDEDEDDEDEDDGDDDVDDEEEEEEEIVEEEEHFDTSCLTLVQPTIYNAGGRMAVAFTLPDGVIVHSWQDEWEMNSDRRTLVLKNYGVFFQLPQSAMV